MSGLLLAVLIAPSAGWTQPTCLAAGDIAALELKERRDDERSLAAALARAGLSRVKPSEAPSASVLLYEGRGLKQAPLDGAVKPAPEARWPFAVPGKVYAVTAAGRTKSYVAGEPEAGIAQFVADERGNVYRLVAKPKPGAAGDARACRANLVCRGTQMRPPEPSQYLYEIRASAKYRGDKVVSYAVEKTEIVYPPATPEEIEACGRAS